MLPFGSLKSHILCTYLQDLNEAELERIASIFDGIVSLLLQPSHRS